MARPKKQPGEPRIPRPHVWKCGSDEFKHSMYSPWQQAKAQAKFRKEEFLLTFEEYYDLWKNRWAQRGRNSCDYCMTRFNHEKPWQKDNILILTRGEQVIRSRILVTEPKKKGKTYAAYKI